MEKGTEQGDPILFFIVSEIEFLFMIANKCLKWLSTFNQNFPHWPYTDNATFLLNNGKSITEIFKISDHFSRFSGLKPNKFNFMIVGIGAVLVLEMALVHVSLGGMKCIDVEADSVKIFGANFPFNEKVENDENYRKHVVKIEKHLRKGK